MADTSKPNPKFHPIADIFPLMSKAEFQDLVEDIREHGQIQPIFLYKGLVIDGRNRWRACEKLNLVPETIEYNGDESELAAFVVSLNLKRRHLDTSQRAMVADNLANLEQGRPEKNVVIATITQPQAADMLNVSRQAVINARVVRDKGSPELVAAVEAGDVAVSAAAEVAKEYESEPETQKDIVEKGQVKKVASDIRKKKAAINTKGKAFFDSFDREEASCRVGAIALDITLIVEQHNGLSEEFTNVFRQLTELQQYIFPQHNQ